MARAKQADKLTIKKKLTNKEFQQRMNSILLQLSTEVRAFPDTSDKAIAERKTKAAQDPFFFFKTYLPHYFSDDFAPFHYQLIELLDQRPDLKANQVITPVAIAAPREFAKSTITSFGYTIHQICNNLRHFIIICSDTEDLASDLTGYIYLDLLYNERIKSDYGDLVAANWAVDDYVTTNDVRIMARGRGQRIRGLKHKNWRPDLVILDDIENDKNVKNPRLVKELLGWIKGTVYGGVDRGGNIFMIGTILDKKSALNQILAAEEEPWANYIRRLYRAIQDDGTSLWPQRYSLQQLQQQKRMMGSIAFNKEKQNNPVDEEGVFKEEWFLEYAKDIVIYSRKKWFITGFWDPSIEAKASSDYKAIVTVGLDPGEMIFYVLDAFIRKCSIDAALLAAYNRHDEFKYTAFGVEDTLFQKLLLREFDRMAREKGYYLPVRGIPHTTAKESRISSLSPYIERGKIRFNKHQGDQGLLIEQMIFFPNPTVHDDGPDALEGAVSLCQVFSAGTIEPISSHTRESYKILRGYS